MIGVVIIAIILCKKNGGHGTTVVQSPQMAHALMPLVQPHLASVPDVTLNNRMDGLEKDVRELRGEIRNMRQLEGKLADLQKKYEDITLML